MGKFDDIIAIFQRANDSKSGEETKEEAKGAQNEQAKEEAKSESSKEEAGNESQSEVQELAAIVKTLAEEVKSLKVTGVKPVDNPVNGNFSLDKLTDEDFNKQFEDPSSVLWKEALK